MLNIYERRNKYTPRSVTQEKIDAVLEEIKKRGHRKQASWTHGISERHFKSMVEMGEFDLENDNPDTMCAKMVQKLNNIELSDIQDCMHKIYSSRKGHKGCQWTLEKMYPRQFGNDSLLRELSEKFADLEKTIKGERSSEEGKG